LLVGEKIAFMKVISLEIPNLASVYKLQHEMLAILSKETFMKDTLYNIDFLFIYNIEINVS
jgi:hypothetical protein